MDVERWSRTASDNAQAVPDGAPEGWTGSQVNNWGRETMAAVRRVWESDIDRNVVVLPGGTKSSVVRDSATQFTIQSSDRTAALPVGRRVLVDNGSISKWCTVVSSTFTAGNTVVVVTPDPDADGTGTPLGTGLLTFDEGLTRIVDDGSGSDPTPFTDPVVGDVLRISAGSVFNLGFWQITAKNINEREVDVTPLGEYVLLDEGPIAATINWIDAAGALPATIVDVYIHGVHTGDAQIVKGNDPLHVPTNKELGNAAYMQARQLVLRQVAEGVNQFSQGDDERAITVKRVIEASGTADSGSGTTLVDAALTGAGDDFYNGMDIEIYAGTGIGQRKAITDFSDATGTVAVASFSPVPDNTSQYRILGPPTEMYLGQRLPVPESGDAGKAIVVADNEDGYRIGTLRNFRRYYRVKSSSSSVIELSEQIIAALSGEIPAGEADFDGLIVRFTGAVNFSGDSAGIRVRVRVGTTGTLSDTIIYDSGFATVPGNVSFDRLYLPNIGDRFVIVTYEKSGTAGANTVQPFSGDVIGPAYDTPSGNGTWLLIERGAGFNIAVSS